MVYELHGRNALITGGGRGLGAEIARRFASSGCNIAINEISPDESTKKLVELIQSKYNVKTTIIQGDAGDPEICYNSVRETIKVFGGIDIIIANAGWTKFSTFSDLDALGYEEWHKAFDVNVLGPHALFKEALPTFNSNPDGGVFISTSSVAGKTMFGSSMAYSVTKSAQLHLIKCLAATQGAKVRVNAVLPGLMLTDWGNQVGEESKAKWIQQSTLKKDTSVEDCAEMYVSIARNESMTGQFVHVDSGLFVQHL